MNTIEMPPTYTVGQGVRTLVPVQIAGWASPCTPGYLFWVVEDQGDIVVIRRDNSDATPVAKTDIEAAYQVVNGTSYSTRTLAAVTSVLERCRQQNVRIHLHLGYTEKHEKVNEDPSLLGRDWLDEWDVEGTIGRSMGPTKIPLLIKSSRSLGGGGLLDDCIIKITTTTFPRRTLCVHPNYHHGKVTIRQIGATEMPPSDRAFDHTKSLHELGYTTAVDVDGQNQANFKTRETANRYLKKLGLRALEHAGT